MGRIRDRIEDEIFAEQEASRRRHAKAVLAEKEAWKRKLTIAKEKRVTDWAYGEPWARPLIEGKEK